MKTNFKHWAMLLAAVVSFGTLSCKKEQPGPDGPAPEPDVAGEIALLDDSVPAQGLVFGPEADEWTFSFKATKAWTAESTADWVRLSSERGNAGDKVNFRISVTANDGYDDRSASVTLACEASKVNIPVTQKQKGALVLAPQTISVAAEGASLEIKLMANVEVSVSTDSDWIRVVQTRALTEYAYAVEVAANEAYEPRQGKVTFSSPANSEVITIAQEGLAAPDPEDPDDPDDPDENPFFNDLETVTETTVWAGAVFDAIIDAGAPGQTEYTTADGENFIDLKLGYLAGETYSEAEDKTTYGKFKFKKDEKAYVSGTKMSRVQLGGTGVVGKRNNLVFKVNGPGALTVVGRSSGDAERPLIVAVNGEPIEPDGYGMPDKNVDSKTVSIAVDSRDGDLVYLYSGNSSLNLYSIKWVPGGSPTDPDDPNDPDDPDTPAGDIAELECTNPPATGNVEPDKMTGYAEAAGVTGGEGATTANTLHFDTGKALQTWLLARAKSEKKGDHSPVIIWLSGTFGPEDGRDFSAAHPWFDVKDVSNLSFYGTDDFVMDRIGLFCVRASNIIIRNINFRQPKADNGADAVSMQECDGVWVDHCTFTSLNQTKDYEDGSCDITHGSKNVTVSWNRFIKTQKSCLVGHSNSQTSDTGITVTFHHNWFDNSSSRHPRVRFGKAHVYNNFYDGCTTYGAGSAYGAMVLVEYNYFDGVQLPTDICTYPAKDGDVSNLQGSVAGYLYATEDVYVNRPAKARDPYPLTNVKYTSYNGGTLSAPLTYTDFQPKYDYMVTPAEEVPSVVRGGAGYGKLGWTTAPVAVNNGGITDFNGNDDGDDDGGDNGDGGDGGDDPGTGGGDFSEGWHWVNNGATASYALNGDDLSITSSGKWESKAQTFGAVYREYTGDFTATVRLVSYDPTKDSNQAVAGIIVIDGEASATATDLVFAIGGGKYGDFRAEKGKDKSGFTLSAPATSGSDVVLQMVREGNKVKISYSTDGGATFGSASSKEFTALSETVKIGLAANSGDNSKTSVAVFRDFTVNGETIKF